jgi:hypothetical protein
VDKYNRNYKLNLEQKDGTILQISPPFTLEFDVTRNILSSANIAQFRVYNLSQTHRNQIRKNEYDYGTFRAVSLSAGYGTKNLPTIFDGMVSRAFSDRPGTNFVTTVECYDGGFAQVNGIINEAYPSGSDQKNVLGDMMSRLPKVKMGKVGNSFKKTLEVGNSYSGNTVDVLNQLSQSGFFIDNGKAYCLGDNECIQGELTLIDSSTGLLGTPVLQDTFLNFDILFEPRLLIGQLVLLQSSTANQYNGAYKVVSVKHRGVISEAVSGECRTTVGLTKGLGTLEIVK